MRVRPWPIVILALIQLFLPCVAWLCGSLHSRRGPLDWIDAIYMGHQSYEVALFFVLPFVAALAIFCVRLWSYPTFVAAAAWGFYHYTVHWEEDPALFPRTLLAFVAIYQLAIAAYMFIPSVLRIYFQPNLIWWRAKPRYVVNVAAATAGAWGESHCELIDLSEGGAFVVSTRILLLDDTVQLKFTLFGHELKLRARVTHRTIKGGNAGFGLQFRRMGRAQRRALREVTQQLEARQFRRTPRPVDLREDFRAWARGVVRNGEGLLPVIERVSPSSAWSRLESAQIIPIERPGSRPPIDAPVEAQAGAAAELEKAG